MVTLQTTAVVVVGLVLLALLARDTWLRTLASRKVDAGAEHHAQLATVTRRVDNLTASLTEHHDRLIRLERAPGVRRA